MTPEKQVENAIRRALDQRAYYENKTFSGPHTNKGIPDIIGVGAGKYFAIEVKRPVGGKPTPVQLKHLRQIANNGGLAFVASSEAVVDLIAMTNAQRAEQVGVCQVQLVPDCDIEVPYASKLWHNAVKTGTVLQIMPDAARG